MIDVKISNGDVAVDSTGSPVSISGADAKFQRALICLTVPKGSFVYDRELGTRRFSGSTARRELLFNEALARYPGERVKVTGTTETGVTVRIYIGGESRVAEVRNYGNISGNI